MTLGDFELLPGVVINNKDPLNQGRVKAVSPGLFDTTTMDEDDLFWINPFMMIGHQSFSMMEISSKIWILHNKNNYFEYWYIPMFEINGNAPKNVHKTNADVVLSRSVAGQTVQLYYSRKDGYNFVIGDNKIQLTPDGAFNVVANDASIVADNNGITLSKSGEETFSAVKAEPLIDALSEFCTELSTYLVSAINYSPMTAHMSSPILEAAEVLKSKLEDIKSTFVKIS